MPLPVLTVDDDVIQIGSGVCGVRSEDFVHEALKGSGAPNNPNGSVTNWCNPNGVVKADFSLDKGDKGICHISPASNKNERYPADQATRQPAALDRRRTSTPHSPCDNPRRTDRAVCFRYQNDRARPVTVGLYLLLPSLALPLILTDHFFLVSGKRYGRLRTTTRLRLNMV